MKTELKPCPFCGMEKMRLSRKSVYGRPQYYITCFRCHVTMTWYKEEDAIAAWNRRIDKEEAPQSVPEKEEHILQAVARVSKEGRLIIPRIFFDKIKIFENHSYLALECFGKKLYWNSPFNDRRVTVPFDPEQMVKLTYDPDRGAFITVAAV